MDSPTFIISILGSSVVTSGITAIITKWQTTRTDTASAKKTEAEAEKIQADSDTDLAQQILSYAKQLRDEINILNARVDVLTAQNTEFVRMVAKLEAEKMIQQSEINELRAELSGRGVV